MIPISTLNSPSSMLELIYRLKVKDVMTVQVFHAQKDTPMRAVQNLMRENRISGVPILDEERLVGIVSVDDIIRALDQGYIDSPAGLHMSKKLVVLEDDMPLSFAISYFEKYRYGRFPVIDRNRALVGIISSRDIMSSLLLEMNKTIAEMENEINRQKVPAPADQLEKVFLVRQFDYENAGRASTEIKKLLQERGLTKATLRRVAIAGYELEMNLVNHSIGGQIVFSVSPDRAVIETFDKGPGIADLERAMTEGFSTANDWIRSLGFGAGMGLPNTKRVSDEFEIQSALGAGTHVKATIFLQDGPG